jgi:hypothetical protein
MTRTGQLAVRWIEEITMRCIKVEDFLARLPSGRQLVLKEKAHPAVTLPPKDPSFLRPPLLVVEETEDGSSPFVIVSAPGAVGKTALARHIAAEKNYFLWDLARLKLGDNSFIGTIAQCFGAASLQSILESLGDGSVGFVFDAFDEAELLSGWQRVENFLDELIDYSRNARTPCFVLLARSETAALVSFYLQDKGVDCPLLEIGYFLESESKEFIGLQVERLARERSLPELAERYKQHKGPFNEAIDAIFASIYDAFSVRPDVAWTNSVVRSFLGYAPVLQAIASDVSSYTNYLDVRKAVRDRVFTGKGPSIASSIMQDLLRREQAKVVSALEGKGLSGAEGWKGWDEVYPPEEQLERILLRVLKSDNATELQSDRSVPSWLAEHYRETLKSFLPQHPFLRETDFSGPAFRDYTLASLLKSPADSLRTSSRELMQKPTYVATPLLIQFYRADGHELVWGEDAGFFYESFSSRDTVTNLSSTAILLPPTSDAVSHTFELFDAGPEGAPEPTRLFVRGDSPVNVVFSRRLRQAVLIVEGVVTLGNATNGFEITDSEIICRTLVVRSRVFIVRSSTQAQAVEMRAETYEQIPPTIDVQTRGPGRLAVSWPGAKLYPWATFVAEATGDTQRRIEQDSFLGLRRILAWFRRDKKEDLARHRDLIRNVAVGENFLRQRMLEFLIHRGIIFEDEPLFKVNISMLSAAGINYSDLRQGRATESISRFLEEFEFWLERLEG